MSGQTESGRERVFVGLGGNVGDPAATMAGAVKLLRDDPEISVVAVSSLYRTPPWGKLDQPDFLNAVVELRTKLEPRQLLDKCLEIERYFKRERRDRWGPRTIDLDIIAYGSRSLTEDGLEIPHPRLASRAFVLVPMNEIASEFRIGDAKVKSLCETVDTVGISKIAEAESWLERGG